MRVLGVGCSLGRVSSSCCRGLVLPLLAAAASTSSDDAQRAFLQGNTLYGSGELEGAKAAYTSCLSSDSSRTDCATNLASVLVDLGDEDFAEELYRSVLSTEDQGYHGDAAFNLALLLQDKKTEGATREAAALYKQSIDADERPGPTSPPPSRSSATRAPSRPSSRRFFESSALSSRASTATSRRCTMGTA